MKSFKRFVKPVKIGFASIHPRDQDIDQILKPKPFLAKISLLSSNKKRIDNSIKEEFKSEDPEFYQQKLEKHLKSRNLSPNGNKPINFVSHSKVDSDIFSNHVASNIKHEINSSPEFKAFNSHYSEESKRINHHLISKHIGNKVPKQYEIKNHERNEHLIHHLSNLTNNEENALKKPTIVHSGAGEEMHKSLLKTGTGEKVHFPAFTSTSTDTNTSHYFGEESRKGDSSHMSVIHFHLPKGYKKGRYLGNIPSAPDEHEVLLHHGQTFKKVGYQTTKYKGEGDIDENGEFKRSNIVIHHHHFVPVEEE